jgi:3-(3-hydroxy-phenyl)propionate hydroxylase
MPQAGFIDYPFDFVDRAALQHAKARQEQTPVAIIGAGPAGLTAALALCRQGIRCTIVEADRTVCFGSRAICFSRRTLEIYQRLGIADTIMQTALPWTAGRSYYRDTEVLHFFMPHDANQRFAPMVNMEQFRLEEMLVHALEKHTDLVHFRWGCRLTSLQQGNESVRLFLEDDSGPATLDASWVVACDGGRSLVREQAGLKLQGQAYEGRYVIVDIRLESARPTERLAWFDPPSNPGSTILMHKQPGGMWRIDYQLQDDADPVEAVKPEHVIPLVDAHLKMIGENGSWAPIWISLYKANALALERFREGRLLFAGDAAHLVPIFGVRGANSSIDDADNLAWKLALVVNGTADQRLLDSYSTERRFAAIENLRHGMKSTEFMAPPNFAFALMREAVLDLAVDHEAVRSLINPRQSSAITYLDSALNAGDSEDLHFNSGPRAGEALHSVPLMAIGQEDTKDALFMTDLAETGSFLLLRFGDHANTPIDTVLRQGAAPLVVIDIAAGSAVSAGSAGPADHLGKPAAAGQARVVTDHELRATKHYDGVPGASYLVRPDGHVLGRWRDNAPGRIAAALADALFGLKEVAFT